LFICASQTSALHNNSSSMYICMFSSYTVILYNNKDHQMFFVGGQRI